MKKLDLNKNGAAYIGLIASVLVIILVFFGSFYFSGNKTEQGAGENQDIIKTYKTAEDDLRDIGEVIDSRNDELRKMEDGSDVLVSEESLETDKWHLLERENEGFEVSYPQGWYYTVNHEEAMDEGYEFIIGFESSEKVWNQEPPYSIELVVSDKTVEADDFSYIEEIETEAKKKFFIRTGKNGQEPQYRAYAEKMAESFKLK